MILTTNELAKYLQVEYRQAYRLAKMLKLPTKRKEGNIVYVLAHIHPLLVSIRLVSEVSSGNAKPLYSLNELAVIWDYSREGVRLRLNEIDVPIYNREGKGFIYLSDLVRSVKIANKLDM